MKAIAITAIICGTIVAFFYSMDRLSARREGDETALRRACIAAGGTIILASGGHHCVIAAKKENADG
jgi:hypothetical protein